MVEQSTPRPQRPGFESGHQQILLFFHKFFAPCCSMHVTSDRVYKIPTKWTYIEWKHGNKLYLSDVTLWGVSSQNVGHFCHLCQSSKSPAFAKTRNIPPLILKLFQTAPGLALTKLAKGLIPTSLNWTLRTLRKLLYALLNDLQKYSFGII